MRARVPILAVALSIAVALLAVVTPLSTAHASQVSGAIFTTNADGTEVNLNQYPSKEAVYLDGGPGPGAPAAAAGLPDGTYVFQVTDPSGKILLSEDAAGCRQVVVSGGVFSSVVDFFVNGANCKHVTGDNTFTQVGSITVQLMPYSDTPNNGGVYKVWMTSVLNYQCPLAVRDCGFTAGSNVHGFAPSDSKTDNYKVKQAPIREIDTTFYNVATGQPIDGMSELWTDTLNATNVKWQYTNDAINVHHQAHVEGVEPGTHLITFYNQPGCTVGEVDTQFPGQIILQTSTLGPQTVSVSIPKTNNQTAMTWYLMVYCTATP